MDDLRPCSLTPQHCYDSPNLPPPPGPSSTGMRTTSEVVASQPMGLGVLSTIVDACTPLASAAECDSIYKHASVISHQSHISGRQHQSVIALRHFNCETNLHQLLGYMSSLFVCLIHYKNSQQTVRTKKIRKGQI